MSAVIIQIIENRYHEYIEVMVDGKSCGRLNYDEDSSNSEDNIAEDLHDIINNILIKMGIKNVELEMK